VILVAGGTGRLGRLVVARLADRGIEVRVMTRDPARAAGLAGPTVEVAKGDVRDSASLERATAGVDVVVSAVHGLVGPRSNSPATVDRAGNANLVDASKAAGADFVLVSTVGAAPDSAMDLFRMKYAAEQYAAASGVRTTVVRATAFMELWIELLRQTAGRSGRPLVFGRGENPVNFVSVADVADVVERVVTDPSTRGQTLEVGGPENLTLRQVAEAVQAAAGRSGEARHVPRPMLRVMGQIVGRVKPQLGRQARAALAMDRMDLTFDAAAIHLAYPELSMTSLAKVLANDEIGYRS
jgi:uncharacterized protein YbjT (DUF2867 family)